MSHFELIIFKRIFNLTNLSHSICLATLLHSSQVQKLLFGDSVKSIDLNSNAHYEFVDLSPYHRPSLSSKLTLNPMSPSLLTKIESKDARGQYLASKIFSFHRRRPHIKNFAIGSAHMTFLYSIKMSLTISFSS